jgi:hypothetical protein
VGVVALALALLPLLWFAGRDALLHRKVRRPTLLESLLHAVLGVAQAVLISCAFRAELKPFCAAAAVIALFGAADEFGFHRGLPEVEASVHAKAHFSLFIFVLVAAARWGAQAAWRTP